MRHGERHRTGRIGWLRAAVLGANDGIVSTASLVLGVAAAQRDARGHSGRRRRRPGRRARCRWPPASTSPSARRPTPRGRPRARARGTQGRRRGRAQGTGGDLRRPRPGCRAREAGRRPTHGARRARRARARRTRHHAESRRAPDPGGARLGLQLRRRRGAAPRGRAIAPKAILLPAVSATSLVFLALLGALAARAGGANMLVGAWRVTFWGALAMAVTAGIGALFGTVA